MSSHILMATVTGIALSTPAWAHEPAETPIDTDIEAVFLHPVQDLEAILFYPAEAPIDTEMKILWLERIEAALWENTAAGGPVTARTGATVLEHQPASTNANLAAKWAASCRHGHHSMGRSC